MKRALLLFLFSLGGLVGCEPTKPATKDTSATATSASATATAAAAASAKAAPAAASASASASPAAPASAAPAKGACAALEWDGDKMNAKATSFTGTVGNGEGENGRAQMEKFQTLVLDKPACGPDGAPVSELQLYTNDKSIALAKMVGKKVAIDGEPFASHTAHHHRPIVVEVKKLKAD